MTSSLAAMSLALKLTPSPMTAYSMRRREPTAPQKVRAVVTPTLQWTPMEGKRSWTRRTAARQRAGAFSWTDPGRPKTTRARVPLSSTMNLLMEPSKWDTAQSTTWTILRAPSMSLATSTLPVNLKKATVKTRISALACFAWSTKVAVACLFRRIRSKVRGTNGDMWMMSFSVNCSNVAAVRGRDGAETVIRTPSPAAFAPAAGPWPPPFPRSPTSFR
mmetsp:Transcript_17287/g.56195  ORF Transcript_17287/g.56195 Transcript_17287/m.56195 type:complete len:218 (+) Transcript_17287:391-1044(+)